jgi:dihydroflavonol-4-reductase
MRILVTGATGLIGVHAVARLLEAGHGVRVLLREPRRLAPALCPLGGKPEEVEVATGDVRDARAVGSALAGCDGLLHCAGLFSSALADRDLLWDVNVEGTRTALGAAVEMGLERIVFVSSVLALFPPRGPLMTADDEVTEPRSMYAATKAEAERFARSLRPAKTRVSIVYPAACHGPHDPTFSAGPQLVAQALRTGEVLVTEGGLPYTDVRDLADVIAALFDAAEPPARLMGPAFYLRHERYRALLSELTARPLKARRVPGWLLRAMGRFGDLTQRFGRPALLTSEAAQVLTRSVPSDQTAARALLRREAVPEAASFRDLLTWMHEAGHLDAKAVGRLAGGGSP